jgi:hypothetical protein
MCGIAAIFITGNVGLAMLGIVILVIGLILAGE